MWLCVTQEGKCKHTLACFSVVSKWVQSQWCRVDRVGNANSLLNIVHSQNRNQRTERLVHNHGVFLIFHQHNGSLHKVLILVHLSTNQDFSSRVIKHFLDSQE